jgi:hypothetical protein
MYFRQSFAQGHEIEIPSVQPRPTVHVQSYPMVEHAEAALASRETIESDLNFLMRLQQPAGNESIRTIRDISITREL